MAQSTVHFDPLAICQWLKIQHKAYRKIKARVHGFPFSKAPPLFDAAAQLLIAKWSRIANK
jgi:hypothetical protein